MGRFLLRDGFQPVMRRVSTGSPAAIIVGLRTVLAGGDEVGPRVAVGGGNPTAASWRSRRYPQWQRDYLALLTQRDLPSWGLPARPQTTDRLLRMLTALHGQTWNASQIGQSLGLSYHTINSYLDYLVTAFLIRRLPPYVVPTSANV